MAVKWLLGVKGKKNFQSMAERMLRGNCGSID